MSAATDIQSGAAFIPEAPAPTNDDLIEKSGDLLALTCLAHDIPADFDGCAVSILREPGTNRLLALILSPVDMHVDEPFPRYAVDPHHVAAARGPKLVLPN